MPSPSPSPYSEYNGYPGYPGAGGVPFTGPIIPPIRPKNIFFPPNPPPLGVEVSVDRQLTSPGTPRELADYVDEPFYASLSTHLFERSLRDDLRRRVEDYRTLRDDLLEQLRNRLRALSNVDAGARLRALEQLSLEQTPKLIELEKAAERLRVDLTPHGWGSDGTGNWYGLREWKVGRGQLARPREQIAVFEYQLMRAAAFYQDKLLLAQRRLLREIAMEMEEKLFQVDGDVPVQSPYLFFSPEMARVMFPADLPAELSAKIDGYREEKAAIKRELQDVIFEADHEWFTSGRNGDCQRIAEAQAPRLDALEAEAEAIRRDLTRVSSFERLSPVPPLPEGLQEDIDKYTAEKKAYVRGVMQRVEADGAKARHPSSTSAAAVRDWLVARRHAVQEATEKYREENAEIVSQMEQRLERIHDAIEKFDDDALGFSLGRLDDQFLSDFLARVRQKESTYEFWAAAFEPGMSPQQRRLLYDGAIVALRLPLPGPEKQPTTLPGTILR